MTTYFAFNPPSDAPFTFQPTLDGQTYTASVFWLFWSQRWYVTLIDQFGNRIFTLPLIYSTPTSQVESIAWSNATTSGQVTVILPTPVTYPIGSLVDVYFYSSAPAAYNGLFRCAVLNPTTLTYPLDQDPGMPTAIGVWSQDVSMTAGYFDSTLIFRPSTGNFEVNP